MYLMVFVCNINMKMLYADEDTKLVCYNYLFYLWFLITGYNILLISFLPILFSTLYCQEPQTGVSCLDVHIDIGEN